MFEQFTEHARKVLGLARQEAQKFNHDYIGTEHILLGLILDNNGIAATILRNANVDMRQIRLEVEKLVEQGPQVSVSPTKLPFTPRAKRAIDYAKEEAKSMGHPNVGTEHLLLGILFEAEGIAAKVLDHFGINAEDVRSEIISMANPADSSKKSDDEDDDPLPKKSYTPAPAKDRAKTPSLDAFGRDLTELAREGKLDPVVARDAETERVIQILCRRTKNNPVLIGEAGVGKTAIVEGLAQEIVAGRVPEFLKDYRLITLDLAAMVAGTKYRGQFEERIKSIMTEVKKAKNIILFIDELHTLVGAGGAEGAIDASNVLKPALSRGEMQMIGATTMDEYRKYIEKDTALERRFQQIIVEPPSTENTIKILHGLKSRYESHHHVKFTNEAIKQCVELSVRYVSGRFLPDKAIDVMDEAGSRMRLRSVPKLPSFTAEHTEIDKLETEKDRAISNQEYEHAAQIRDKILNIRREIEQKKSDLLKKSNDTVQIIDSEVIYETISKMTGIPLTRIDANESERLLHIEDTLHTKVISQDDAINQLARAVRRSRAGLKDPKRPIGCFLFVGPTGVGKTLLCKALANFMFGTDEALIQLDMSEYMEKFNVSRLVGAPPGYVGYEEGGQLTETIRRKPYSVILLDEIEKAHPDIYNILLQAMEEGKLTDSFGRVIDFRNTIIIMTSNIGAGVIKNQTNMSFVQRSKERLYSEMKDTLMNEVGRYFKPEFLNRLDEILIFKPLTREDLHKVFDIEISGVYKRMAQHGIDLTIPIEVKNWILDTKDCVNLEYGARPLRRAIEKYIENPLSETLLKSGLSKEFKVVISIEKLEVGSQLRFELEKVGT